MTSSILALALLAGSAPSDGIGKPVADVKLTATDGKSTTLHAFKGKTVVAVFLSFECPVSNSYAPVLNELAKSYQDKNIVFLALAPAQDDAAVLAKQAKEF